MSIASETLSVSPSGRAWDEGWLVEVSDECTCGTGGLPAHMYGCGSEPIREGRRFRITIERDAEFALGHRTLFRVVDTEWSPADHERLGPRDTRVLSLEIAFRIAGLWARLSENLAARKALAYARTES